MRIWLKCTYELKGLNSLTLGAGMHAQPQWNAHSDNTSGKQATVQVCIFLNIKGLILKELCICSFLSSCLTYIFYSSVSGVMDVLVITHYTLGL